MIVTQHPPGVDSSRKPSLTNQFIKKEPSNQSIVQSSAEKTSKLGLITGKLQEESLDT